MEEDKDWSELLPHKNIKRRVRRFERAKKMKRMRSLYHNMYDKYDHALDYYIENLPKNVDNLKTHSCKCIYCRSKHRFKDRKDNEICKSLLNDE